MTPHTCDLTPVLTSYLHEMDRLRVERDDYRTDRGVLKARLDSIEGALMDVGRVALHRERMHDSVYELGDMLDRLERVERESERLRAVIEEIGFFCAHDNKDCPWCEWSGQHDPGCHVFTTDGKLREIEP